MDRKDQLEAALEPIYGQDAELLTDPWLGLRSSMDRARSSCYGHLVEST